jgi:hypothetical protein
MSKNYDTIHCDVEWIGDRSIRVFGDWGQELLIPISIIEGGNEVSEGADQDLNVETWFLKQEGLV